MCEVAHQSFLINDKMDLSLSFDAARARNTHRRPIIIIIIIVKMITVSGIDCLRFLERAHETMYREIITVIKIYTKAFVCARNVHLFGRTLAHSSSTRSFFHFGSKLKNGTRH